MTKDQQSPNACQRALTRRSFLSAVLSGATLFAAGCSQPAPEPAPEQSDEREVVYDEVAPQEVSLVMIGDVLVHTGVWESGVREDGTRNYDHLFAQISDEVSAADLAIVGQQVDALHAGQRRAGAHKALALVGAQFHDQIQPVDVMTFGSPCFPAGV